MQFSIKNLELLIKECSGRSHIPQKGFLHLFRSVWNKGKIIFSVNEPLKKQRKYLKNSINDLLSGFLQITQERLIVQHSGWSHHFQKCLLYLHRSVWKMRPTTFYDRRKQPKNLFFAIFQRIVLRLKI